MWVYADDGYLILWIFGGARIGKSSVANSVATFWGILEPSPQGRITKTKNKKTKNKKQKTKNKKQSEKGHPSYDIIFTSSMCRLRSITVVSLRGTCVLWHRGYWNGYC
jgi:hypothetical protein